VHRSADRLRDAEAFQDQNQRAAFGRLFCILRVTQRFPFLIPALERTMTFRNFRLVGLAAIGLVLGTIGFALAQSGSYQIVSPTGQEQVQINSASSAYNNTVELNTIRNSTGYSLLASASGTLTPTTDVNTLAVSAQPSTGTTIDTPAGPYDGELFQVCNVTSSAWATNTVTLAAATGSSLNTGTTTALTTLAAHSCEELLYDATTTKWYQLR